MQKLSKIPLTAQPSAKFTYGPSTDILGYLIEKLTNMNLFTERIFLNLLKYIQLDLMCTDVKPKN